MGMQTERIETLEMHAAHQDQAIADLNEALQTQWRRIEALERQIARLREALMQMTPPGPAAEPPPPHY